MTTPSDDALLFDVHAPAPATPVERLLGLADLYTQHNDRIDLLFGGRADLVPNAYAASSLRLEREALTSIKAVRQQPLPAIEPVSSAIVRLKQIAYLTGGATRYLIAARQAVPEDDVEHARPDRRHGFGQYIWLARELTALAPQAIVESATHIAARLPDRARSKTTLPGLDASKREVLLEVARGHVIVSQQYSERDYGRTVTVDVEVLRCLEDQGLVTREPGSAPPFFPGGPSLDRVRLTALGISVLSTVLDSPRHVSMPAVGPVPAPAEANTTHARR
ncbi:hypothetical protein SUDANB105_00762 [Streptomyces sp. enrichment culture]|uniref:hypothetical protein n=1 Tax=Streptomyces sp. enrichment culture TaxID=1795815 RepID=UPI003F567464